MSNILLRGLIEKVNIRFSYALITDLANEVIIKQNCDPVAAHIFSRCLTAATLSNPLLGDDERLTIRWQYEDQPLESIIVEVLEDGAVRGTISPPSLNEFMGQADNIKEICGDSCQLSVVKSLNAKVLNSGMINATLSDPVSDLGFFYSTSDQVETAISCMIAFNPDPKNPVKLAQGLMIQALPDCDLEYFETVRHSIEHGKIKSLLSTQPDIDNYFEKIIHVLLGDDNLSDELLISTCPEPFFRCSCSKEKMINALAVLPAADRLDIAIKGDDLKINCNFCKEKYTITVDEFKAHFGE